MKKGKSKYKYFTKIFSVSIFVFLFVFLGFNLKQAHAAITFQAKGTFTSGASALTVPVPAGYADGDVFLLFVETANQAVTTPSGWTQLTNSPQGTGTAAAAGGVRLTVFYKVVSGTQSSVTVADSGDHQTAIIMNFRGVDTTTPIEITAGSVGASATTAMSFPTVTTSSANDMIVLAAALDADANSTAAVTGWTNANLTSITEQHDQTVTTGAGGGLGIATGFKATAGAVGTSTATGSTATTHAYMTIGLKPYIPIPPTVTTTSPVATSITDTSAILNGNITAIGGAAPTVRGFDYSTVSDLSSGVTTTAENGGSSENFDAVTFPPTGWTTGGSVSWIRDTTTTHGASAGSAVNGPSVPDNGTSWISYTKTFANAGQVQFYWKVSSEATYDFLVFCLDLNATCSRTVYTGTNAISGTVDWVQVTVPVSAGTHDFRWLYGKDVSGISGTDQGWIDDVQFVDGFSTGAFTAGPVKGLSCNTTYYARAYATSSQGTGQGTINSFTTTACVAPSVTSPTATNITPNSATLGANVTAQGDSAIVARGTCWDVTANPTANCVAEGGTTTGVFTHSRTGLPIGTLIYYRGYATNANGHTAYSPDGTFSTTGSVTGSLGKTTDSWGGAIPVYGTLSVVTNTDYPYARAKVVTAAGATFYTDMTWSVANSRFEGTIYPGTNYCHGCVDPTTGTFTVTFQIDNNADFSSIDANASTVTFSTFIARRRSSMDAASPTNYTDYNPVWSTDHWAVTLKDFGFYQSSGSAKTNVAIGIPFHPITSTISNIAVTFDGVTVNPGTAASSGVNAWWWDTPTHTLYIQKASMANVAAGSTPTNVAVTFNSDTDLWVSRYDHVETSDMGQRLFYNGLMLGNQYYFAFVYGGGHEGAGEQAETRAHEPGADDDTTDCMERVAVHVDGSTLADSSGYYAYGIKWSQNEWANYITSEDNNSVTVVNDSDSTPTTGWIQTLNHNISVKRTQTYAAGKTYIDNLYEFTNNDTVSHTLPFVWQREQWLSSKTGSVRQVADAARYSGDTSDVVEEQRHDMSTYTTPWLTAYDTLQFNAMGIIFDKANVDSSTYGMSTSHAYLTTSTAEWPIVITNPSATTTADDTGFEQTLSNVAPGTTASIHFGQLNYDTTSWANIQSALDTAYADLNSGGTPSLTQSSYRWRNDDGNEMTASYPVDENTPLTSGVYVGQNRRLRFTISNTGTNTASNKSYMLQYSYGACTSFSPGWTKVPNAGDNSGPWAMSASSFVTDSTNTTDSAGLSNPQGKTFTAGKLMSASSSAPAMTLSSGQFTELEYSITPTVNVVPDYKYCFRLTDGGDATGFTYDVRPEIYAYNIPFVPRTGGTGVESTGTGGTTSGGTGGGTGDTGSGTTAGGIAVLLGNSVNSVTVTAGGNYTVAPTVSFCGGGGSGAAGRAVLTGNAVTSVIIDNGGTNYTSPPTVVFGGSCGGTGGGAGGGDSGFLNGGSRFNLLASANSSGFNIWNVLKYLFFTF